MSERPSEDNAVLAVASFARISLVLVLWLAVRLAGGLADQEVDGFTEDELVLVAALNELDSLARSVGAEHPAGILIQRNRTILVNGELLVFVLEMHREEL